MAGTSLGDRIHDAFAERWEAIAARPGTTIGLAVLAGVIVLGACLAVLAYDRRDE